MTMLKYVVVVAVLLTIAGCSSKTATTASVPGSNPLDQVHVGMSKTRVRELLGPPSSQDDYITWKAWVPFYFVSDQRESAWLYKGKGRVVFADGNLWRGGTRDVVRVEYDPTESGVAH